MKIGSVDWREAREIVEDVKVDRSEEAVERVEAVEMKEEAVETRKDPVEESVETLEGKVRVDKRDEGMEVRDKRIFVDDASGIDRVEAVDGSIDERTLDITMLESVECVEPVEPVKPVIPVDRVGKTSVVTARIVDEAPPKSVGPVDSGWSSMLERVYPVALVALVAPVANVVPRLVSTGSLTEAVDSNVVSPTTLEPAMCVEVAAISEMDVAWETWLY